MMTQNLEISTPTIAQSASKTVSSFLETLQHSTLGILEDAFWLASQKLSLSKAQFKKLVSSLGWKKEQKTYLNVADAFAQFQPQELAHIEPRTIFRLAENRKKYQSVIDQLKAMGDFTQETVSKLIALTRQPKQPKQEEPTIWRNGSDGVRFCQIPPIHDQETGVILQAMMESQGKTAQTIIAESVKLYEDFIAGRLVYNSDTGNLDNQSEASTEESQNFVMGTDSAIGETLSDVLGGIYQESESPEDSNDEVIEDTWCFEVEEKDDDIEDYQMLTSQDLERLELSPVDSLIEALQTATCWSDIKEALSQYGDCKQEAWDGLTSYERRRIMELTPVEVQKLTEAKKVGIIVDFEEIRDGWYKVQPTGSILWEIVCHYRLEEFLSQL